MLYSRSSLFFASDFILFLPPFFEQCHNRALSTQSLSASHIAQEPSWRFTAHSFLRPEQDQGSRPLRYRLRTRWRRNKTLPSYRIHQRPLRYRLRTRWRGRQMMEFEENLRYVPSFDCLRFGLFFPYAFLASLNVLDLLFANESDFARSGLMYHAVDVCMFLKCR